MSEPKPYSIHTENLGRVYKIRGGKKSEPKTLTALRDVNVGQWFFDLGIDWATVKWPLFIVSMVIGVLMLAMMGLMLAGASMLLVRHVGYLGEGVAGALYLFSGAIFPYEHRIQLEESK